jgi:hypothetical protein
MLLIGEEVDWQWQPAPRQHRHQVLVTQRTDETVERHGCDMIEDCAQFQTEAAVGGQQRIPSHFWSHLMIAQDEMRQDRKHGAARGALETPDGKPTQTDTSVMGVRRQAPAATGGLVEELKAKSQEEGKHELDKRLAITQRLKVGGFILEVNGNGAVFARRFGCCAHVSPLCPQVSQVDEIRWGVTRCNLKTISSFREI